MDVSFFTDDNGVVMCRIAIDANVIIRPKTDEDEDEYPSDWARFVRTPKARRRKRKES